MTKKYDDITRPINAIAEEVNAVLNNRIKEKYFEEVVLLYSFIENLLKWLVFVKTTWDKCSNKTLTTEEIRRIRSFCKSLNFYSALNIAFSINLIDFGLYAKIDTIREERNNIVHQFWIYGHRGNFLTLRKRLEMLARATNQLVGIFNKLTEKVGVEEVYELFL